MADPRHITRRFLVKALPFIGIVAAVPAVAHAQAPEPKFDLQGWLDTASPRDVIEYHLTQLTIAMHDRHGGKWRGTTLEAHGRTFMAMAICDDHDGDAVWVKPPA